MKKYCSLRICIAEIWKTRGEAAYFRTSIHVMHPYCTILCSINAQDLHTGCDLLHTSCMFCFCISSARVCFLRIIGWIKFGMSEDCCQAAWHGERWSLSASTRPFYKEDHNGDWQEKDCLELGKCSCLTSSHANQDPKKMEAHEAKQTTELCKEKLWMAWTMT